MPATFRTYLLAHNTTTWLAVVAVASALLAIIGFSNNTSALEHRARSVQHVGAFSYRSPAVRSIVYPDGSIETGDPVFRSATDTLTVNYEHQVRAPAGVTVSAGSLQGRVIVRVGGWEHELARLQTVDLVDGRADVEAEIDADEIEAVLHQYQLVSGKEAAPAVVLVQPAVRATLAMSPTTSRIAEFDTSLDLAIGPEEIGVAQDQLDVEGSESVEVPTLRRREVEILGWSLEVRHARAAGVAGVVGASGLLYYALLVRRRASAGAPIAAAAGSRLVTVAPLDAESTVDVLDARAFRRIADGSDAIVLHSTDDNGTETFIIDDGRTRYRYVAQGPGSTAR